MASSTAKWESVRRQVAEIGRAHVRAGVVGSESHRVHADSGLTLGQLAVLHELGNPSTNLPARSFVGATIEDPQIRAEFAALQASLVRAVLAGSMDRDAALAHLGQWIAERIKRRILDGRVTPPLRPATVAAKGGESRPLVDTHELVDAISFEIVK